MPPHPVDEHERVAAILEEISAMKTVMVQEADTKTSHEDFTECTVTFALKREEQ